MLEIDDNIKIKSGEIFGFVGLVDSGRTTMLRKIYERNSSKISYVDKLPWFQLFKVKTVLKKNYNYEYVKRLDLNVNKRINDLNYNETRKLLFLMSVFTNKEIIILDEPLLLVEDGTKKVMMEIIKELKKTILISFDKIKEAKMICNRYAIIKNFKIVEVKEVNENKDYLAISIKAKNIDKASLPLKNMKISYFSHDEIEFIYKGNINDLLKYLVDIKIDLLEIKTSELEDLYKYYYKD